MLITTANYLPDYKILKTLEPITVNLVLGTNILSDVKANWSDFFGGRSGTYEKRLNALFNEAKANIIEQIKRLGGNGLIGFTVSYNELSGKDKSMLMISIYGTPILIEQNLLENEVSELVNFEEFENKLKSFRVLEYYRGKDFNSINSKDLKFILESRIQDFEEFVYKLINIHGLEISSDSVTNLVNKDDFLDYYRGFDDVVKSEMLYKALDKSLEDNSQSAFLYLKFLKVDKVIDLDVIIKMIKTQALEKSVWYYELALETKEIYCKDDIEKFLFIKQKFEEIANNFEVEIVTDKGMFTSVEKWICPKCKTKSGIDKQICQNCNYEVPSFPKLKITSEKYISELQLRIDVLKSIFKINHGK